MRVKIRDKIYNTDDEPIMIIFDNDEERIEIAKKLFEMKLKKGIRKFCQWPTNKFNEEQIKEFMKI